MPDVNEIIAGLSSGLRKKLTLGNVNHLELQETPSLGLTRALNGGLPYGRQVLVYGSKSSSKSSFCLELVAKAQADGKVCAWIDAEMAYDTDWASRLGVKTDELIVSDARTVNEMVDVGVELMEAGVDVIVVDSITSLLPAVYFDKTHELKHLENTKQIGAEARDFSNAMKMLNYANNKTKPTLLVLISQSRNKITQTYVSHQPTGGMSVKYYSSIIIKLTSSDSDSQAIEEKRELGNRVVTQKVGRKVTWLVQFSKTSPAFTSGSYDFRFVGDVGIDRLKETFDIAVELGIIEKTGAWFKFGDYKWQGADNAVKEIKSNDELLAFLQSEIYNAEVYAEQ